ncbi:L-tryptophan decarboxylase [Fusarium oxysporum f. sp. albedinis]|nr:L-tryptophan decarboxylase [Fusarium oxysporum f. sp. albedinis]
MVPGGDVKSSRSSVPLKTLVTKKGKKFYRRELSCKSNGVRSTCYRVDRMCWVVTFKVKSGVFRMLVCFACLSVSHAYLNGTWRATIPVPSGSAEPRGHHPKLCGWNFLSCGVGSLHPTLSGHSPLSGHGVVSAFRIHKGQVDFKIRYIKNDRYKVERNRKQSLWKDVQEHLLAQHP